MISFMYKIKETSSKICLRNSNSAIFFYLNVNIPNFYSFKAYSDRKLKLIYGTYSYKTELKYGAELSRIIVSVHLTSKKWNQDQESRNQ